MSALNTFGAIMTQAIELETVLGAYYERAGNSSLVAACAKRRSRMTRIRREAVLEITPGSDRRPGPPTITRSSLTM